MNKEYLLEADNMLNKFLNKYQLRHLHKYETPMTISFLVTNRCNLKCKHCFNTINANKTDESELSLEEYKVIAEKMGFFTSGLFCGGEPFVRNDLADIVYLFQTKCNMQWASTTTNGQLTESILKQTEKICKNSKNKNFVLNFSLDGFEKEHEWTRGIGTYDRCISTIKLANELKKKYANLQIGIVSTLTVHNEDSLASFFEYISAELKPDVISLLLVRQHPRGGEDLKNVKYENYFKCKEILSKLFIEGKNGNVNSPKGYYPFGFYEIISKTLNKGCRQFYCYAGQHGAFIDFNGNVNPCEVLGDKSCSNNAMLMGNLREHDMDFLKLWNSESAMKVRQMVNRHECCKECTHETEGILPSIYFEPNSIFYKERIDYFGRETNR
jgi:MoaA/NifB/PqqE/SkfB family radical SAM enzyme